MGVNKIDDFDVVIIGAGIMGLSTAYYLADSGLKICIVERENLIGGYTTLRCAGGIRKQFSSPMNTALSVLNNRLIHKMEKESCCSIPLIPCGYTFAFTNEDSVSQAEKAVKMQREMLVDVEVLTTKDMKSKFPNIYVDDVLFATYSSDDGLLNVGALIGVLKRELRKRNVTILCEKVVCGIETQNKRVSKVILDSGEINASIIVNAAGPWAKEIGKMVNVEVPIVASPQQIWVTEPISWVKQSMPVIIFGDEGIGFHWEAGGLLSGYHRSLKNTEDSFPEIDLDWEIQHCKKAVERIPELYSKSLVSRWAGFYEVTVDDLPIVGTMGPEGMYCIAGFSGHGLMQGLACGYLLSSVITGKSSEIDISCLSIDRFNSDIVTSTEKYKI